MAHGLVVFDLKRAAIDPSSNGKQVFESSLKVRYFPINDQSERPGTNLSICGNKFDLYPVQVETFRGTAVDFAPYGLWKCSRIPTKPSVDIVHVNQNCRDRCKVRVHVKLPARCGDSAM